MTPLWEPRGNVPEHLVLATAPALAVFLHATQGLVGNIPDELEHYVNEVVQCMFDKLPAHDTVDEYLHSLREQLGEIYGDRRAMAFVLALGKFADAVYEQLEAAQVWNSRGVLWYKFDQLLGHDVVLRRESPSGHA